MRYIRYWKKGRIFRSGVGRTGHVKTHRISILETRIRFLDLIPLKYLLWELGPARRSSTTRLTSLQGWTVCRRICFAPPLMYSLWVESAISVTKNYIRRRPFLKSIRGWPILIMKSIGMLKDGVQLVGSRFLKNWWCGIRNWTSIFQDESDDSGLFTTD